MYANALSDTTDPSEELYWCVYNELISYHLGHKNVKSVFLQ